MMHQVTMPDGTIHNFPEEATPDMMSQALGLQPQSTTDAVLDTEKHIFGVPARTIAEGATAIPLMVGSIPAATANAVSYAYNKGFGGHAPYLDLPISQYSKQLTEMGLPEPATGLERVGSEVGKAVMGAGSSIGIAKKALANGSASKIAKLTADNPAALYQGAIGGSLASASGKELGAPPWAQIGLGLAGGVAAPSGVQLAKEMGNVVQPFLSNGRNQIIADLLASKANDPKTAATAINNASTYIPGSVPVAGVASGDTGLMGLQRGVESLPTAEQSFKDRAAQQTLAQNQVLGDVAGNPADITKLAKARDAATAPLYEQAKNQPINRAAIQPVLDELDKKIALAGAQNDSGKLLIELKNKILAGLPSEKPIATGILDAAGNPITRPSAPTLQQPVIGTYRETRDKLALKGMQPGALGAEIKSNVAPANKLLGQALEQQSPSFSQAQTLYKQGTVPINQIEAGQAIKGQIQANTPNAAGHLPIVQPKLQQLMENGVVNVDGKEIPLTALTARQQQDLVALQSDLNRNVQATGARVASTPASELNNLATKSPVNALLSHVPYFGKAITSKNTQIQEQLVKVMLDNPETARLLMMGRNIPNQKIAHMLMNGAAGGELGLATSYGGNQ